MRDIAEWSRELRLEISASPYFQQHLEELGESRGGKPLRHPDVFLIADVELGLALQMQVAPGQPAATVRPLLSGQRHVYAWIQDETNRHMVRVARFYLTSRKGSQWPRALQAYSKLPSELRLYDVDPVTGMVSLGTPRVAADRRDLYLRTLTQTPPHEPVKQRDRATPGKWVVRVSRLGESPQPVILEIPNEVEGISSCQPEFQRTRGALNPQMTIRWEDLAKAAQEMDTRLYESGYADEDYEGRFRRLNWHVFDEDSDDYRESRTFKLNGLHHIVGLLNAGKSTFIEIVAFYLAQRGHRVGVVVSDVVNAVRRSSLFRFGLGTPAAPILGTDRVDHLDKLYETEFVRRGTGLLQTAVHPARNRWFHSGCALLPLVKGDLLWEEGDEPCRELVAESRASSEVLTYHTCPFYDACPKHQRERDLSQSRIWYMTPASLIKTRVPESFPLSTYFAESVYRECDVLLVDEADLIMVQCDREFAPAQVLVDATDTAFIDRLRKVISPISPGASHIGRNVTSAWVVAAYHTLSTTIQVYNRVQTNPRLLIWIGRNPFTGRTLFGRVVSELVDLADETNSEEQITQKDRKSRRVARAQAGPAPEELRRRRARLMDGFRAILEHDIYAPETGSIGDLARRLLHNPDSAAARADVATWCQGWFEGESELAPLRGNARLLEDVTSKVEIALLMTLLEKQLTAVVDDLPAVRRAVDPEDLLEGSFSRPARDYLSVVPEAPVGNITGFTFRQEKRADGPSNLKLEFSRYVGTGRAFLLQFPELFTADRWQGPHTVLVSGTSYAPGSTAHHIPVRPDGILEPLRDDGSSAEEAIAQSEFTFRPQRTLEGKPIRISGLTPGHRAEAVRNMVTAIASPRGRAPSLLQQCQEDLAQRSKSDPQKWNGRSLIGLVLTNYEEADAVSTMLRQTQGVRGQVSAMRRDNAAHTLHGPRRGQLGHLDEFGDLSVLTLVFGAFERGHNPLTADRSKSIFGSLLFVPRPMPVPGDWLTTVQALNAFAWEYRVPSGQTALQEISAVFNHKAHTLLMGAAIWGSAFWQLDDEARRDLAMTMIVRMWQVIGRGIRGNVPVKIDFLDAQFAPEAAVDPLAPAVRQTSLLAAMRWVLQGYIEGKQGRRYEQTLVRRLYGSFYYALSRTGGMRFDDETDFIARI